MEFSTSINNNIDNVQFNNLMNDLKLDELEHIMVKYSGK